MLEFRHLTYSYDKRRDALSDVSLSVGPGLCLVLGENGAGKTTLLALAAGQLRATEGTVEFDGADIAQRRPDTLASIFFLPDDCYTPFRTIRLMARYHAPFYSSFDPAMLDENLAAFGLSGDERIANLSLGMRHKSFIAYGLALRPRLLLLDEPANGLDIDSKKIFRKMMSRCIDEDQTVLISTHTVADLEVLYDSMIILRHGHPELALRTEDISARLSFLSSPIPVDGALYQEADGGVYRAVTEAAEPYSTAVNFELLYSAIMSDNSTQILNLLRQK